MYKYKIEEGPFWQLQEAKAMLSEVVRSANHEPQIITVHGRETVVVLSIENYRKLLSPRKNLVSFLEKSPWASIDLELPERPNESMREINL